VLAEMQVLGILGATLSCSSLLHSPPHPAALALHLPGIPTPQHKKHKHSSKDKDKERERLLKEAKKFLKQREFVRRAFLCSAGLCA